MDTSPPSPSRPTDTAPGPSWAQAPPSPMSAGEFLGPLLPPVTSSHRAGKEPAPYYPSKSTRGRGRGGRRPPGPHYPLMEGARSFPNDFMRSMTQAIERLARATYVAAAHAPRHRPRRRLYIQSYCRPPLLLRRHIRSTVSPTVIPMITDTSTTLRV